MHGGVAADLPASTGPCRARRQRGVTVFSGRSAKIFGTGSRCADSELASRCKGISKATESNPANARELKMDQVSKRDSFFGQGLGEVDPEVFAAIRSELGRQRDEIELIASENIVSRAVLEAQGSVMTNKYAEGYPGRRYYGGCEHVDQAEALAISRAGELFGCEFANVQPHSGSQANQGVFNALLRPG